MIFPVTSKFRVKAFIGPVYFENTQWIGIPPPPEGLGNFTNFKFPFFVCCRSEDSYFNRGGVVNFDTAF